MSKEKISVEVNQEGSIGCFSRSEDKESVVCPMGIYSTKKEKQAQRD